MLKKKEFIYNTGLGIVKQIVAVVCGFILPRYMLVYYGSDLNGLVASITNFLSIITLLEMGIGPVIQANLYKPLAEKNNDQISRILKESDRFFHAIAFIFLVYIVFLCFAFSLFIVDEFEPYLTISLIIIISVSTFAQYFFGMTYQLLLNADQKAYVHTSMQIITLILNTSLCVILMKAGASIQTVKLASSAVFVLRPIGQLIYVKKHYYINKHINEYRHSIQQKWNGFAQHLAGFACGNTDIIVLTIFAQISVVSVYSVYYSVVIGLSNLIQSGSAGIDPLFGRLIAENKPQELEKSFDSIEFAIHFVSSFIFTLAAVLIVPFISVYTRGINDAEYYQPLFAVVLVLAYQMQCIRIPYARMVNAAGHFKETQNGALISMFINIGLSLALVQHFSLVGVAFGTIAAMLYHTVYYVLYLKNRILFRPPVIFLRYLLVDALVTIVSCFSFTMYQHSVNSYLEWTLLALRWAVFVFLIDGVINYVFNKKIVMRYCDTISTWFSRHKK